MAFVGAEHRFRPFYQPIICLILLEGQAWDLPLLWQKITMCYNGFFGIRRR